MLLHALTNIIFEIYDNLPKVHLKQ